MKNINHMKLPGFLDGSQIDQVHVAMDGSQMYQVHPAIDGSQNQVLLVMSGNHMYQVHTPRTRVKFIK